MDEPRVPALCRRWVAMELRRLRATAGMTLPEVAQAMRWSKSKAGHFETTERLPSYEDLQKLTTLYGAEQRLETLWRRTGIGKARGWWEGQRSGGDQYGPEDFARFVGLEQGAHLLRLWHPYLVPGLLQTRDYARAVFDRLSPAGQDHLVDERTELRLRRQDILDRATVRAVIGEGALRLLVGTTAILRDQLQHLLQLAGHPHVDLRVLPDAVGVHRGLHGPFTVLRFPRDPHVADPGLVYVEGPFAATWHEDVAAIEGYTSIHDELVEASADGTVDLIRQHLKEIP